MKILYDGIVKSLQSYGGITVYFEEIIKRLKNDEYKLQYISFYILSGSERWGICGCDHGPRFHI